MRVIYSIGARFAGGGIGDTAYYAVKGIWQAGALTRLLVSSARATEIPPALIYSLGLPGRILKRAALYDRTSRIYAIGDALFDRWAAGRLVPCDIFHGWSTMCRQSLERAKDVGAITILERASSHPQEQAGILRDLYARHGMTPRHSAWHSRQAEEEFARADFIAVPSQFVQRSFLARGFPPEKLLLLPYGVDTERFHPPAEKGRKENRPFRALFVGQVSLRKGTPDLLEAWRRLGWRGAELWIAGRPAPEMRRFLPRYAGLAGVRWLDFVRDPARLYAEADIFVFPTYEEGSALVTYEAMASGMPMITTERAGSIARPGQEALIVPAGDVEALTQAMIRLREEPALRERLGHAARGRAEDFTWDDYGRRLLAAYARLLGEVRG